MCSAKFLISCKVLLFNMNGKLDKVIKEYAIAKVWNDLLDEESYEEKSEDDLVDLDNYVSRLSKLVLSTDYAQANDRNADQLINHLVKSNCQLDKCRSNQNEMFQHWRKTDLTMDSIKEVIVLFDSSDSKAKNESPVNNRAKSPSKQDESNILSVQSNEDSIRILRLLKKALEESNLEEIRSLQNELLTKDVELVRQVCVNLIDIGNFDGKLRTLDHINGVSLKEESLCSLLLNLAATQV